MHFFPIHQRKQHLPVFVRNAIAVSNALAHWTYILFGRIDGALPLAFLALILSAIAAAHQMQKDKNNYLVPENALDGGQHQSVTATKVQLTTVVAQASSQPASQPVTSLLIK